MEDLENRKRDAIKQLNRFLPPFFESTRIHLAFLDPDFNFLMVNPAYLSGSGMKPREILGRNHFEIYPNPDNQAFFENVRDSGEAASFSEKPFIHPDQPWQKTTFWDGTLTPLLSKKGETLGLALSLVDATLRVRESQLREALDDIIFSIRPDRPLDEILSRIMERASIALGADTAAIAMGKKEQWVIRSAHCFPQGFTGTPFKAKDLPHSSRVVKDMRPLLVADAAQDPETQTGAFAVNAPASMLVLPLEARGEVIGLLYYISSRPYAFDELHLNFARSLCAVFGLALNSPILLASLNQELKKGRLFQEITAVASDQYDLPQFCMKVLQIMDNHLNLLNAGFLTLSPGGESIELQASIGLPPEVVEDLRAVPRDKEGYFTNVALDRDKVITHKQDPVTPVRKRKLEFFGLQNSRYVAGPIRNRDRVVGVFLFSFAGRRDFTDEEMNTFKSVGNIIGPIMGNVILLQSERRQRESAVRELEATNLFLELSGSLARSARFDDVAAAVIDAALRIVPECRVTIGLYDLGNKLVEVRASGGKRPMANDVLPLPRTSATGRMLARGETIVFEYEGVQHSAPALAWIQKYDLRRVAAMPLKISDRIIGALYVDQPGELHDFSPRELELLAGIAAQAAVTIENTYLHQKANKETKSET